MTSLNILLAVTGGYAGIGAIFALAFVTRGVGTIDRAARGAPIGFRIVVFPGAAALWPYLLLRWIGAAQHGAEEGDAVRARRAGTTRHRQWHRAVWLVLGPLVLAGLIAAYLARPPQPLAVPKQAQTTGGAR